MNDIPTIAANLHTQDNRITHMPIFLIQQKRRVYGLEESDHYIWIDESAEEVYDDALIKLLDEISDNGTPAKGECPAYDENPIDIDDYRKSYYRDEYVFVQPFFTEHGANEYLKINSHNLREPRIYVESGYRNEEWQTVRAHLMGLRGEGWKS